MHLPQYANPISRADVNRANAQLSTGPRTDIGKEIASRNAVKTALTGHTVMLPTDSAELYVQHLERFRRDHAPASERETELVQALADSQWRLNRIPGLEMTIYTMGRAEAESTGLFADIADRALRAAVIDNHTFDKHFRRLNNLSIQESRLRRNYAKDLAELQALQKERLQTHANPPSGRGQTPPVTLSKTPATPATGFVFATAASATPAAPLTPTQQAAHPPALGLLPALAAASTHTKA